MRHGYHMGYGYYGAAILAVILIIIIVILVVVLLRSKNHADPNIRGPLEIIRERYARGDINADEYRAKKAVIEDERHPDQAVLALMERYARGEISREEYDNIKRDII